MLKRNLAILVLAAAVLGGGAFAWAQTSDGSSTPPTVAASTAATQQAPNQQPPAQQGPSGRGGRQANANASAILRRVIHGDLVVRTKNGFQTVTYDRGTEDGVSGGTLTITRPDNHKVTVTLTSTTKYRGVQDASQLQAGKPTLIVSKDGNALIVGQRPDAANGPATANGPGATATSAPAGQ